MQEYKISSLVQLMYICFRQAQVIRAEQITCAWIILFYRGLFNSIMTFKFNQLVIDTK